MKLSPFPCRIQKSPLSAYKQYHCSPGQDVSPSQVAPSALGSILVRLPWQFAGAHLYKFLGVEWELRSCSIGINRFNRNRFRLKRLRFPNRTLFQPFSVETVATVQFNNLIIIVLENSPAPPFNGNANWIDQTIISATTLNWGEGEYFPKFESKVVDANPFQW